MIQISPHIENSAISEAEAAQTAAQKTAGVKKDGLGVFARLLSGLLRKTKESAGGAEVDSAALEALNPENLSAESGGKKPGKAGKAFADKAASENSSIREKRNAAGDAGGELLKDLPDESENDLLSGTELLAGLIAKTPPDKQAAAAETSEKTHFQSLIDELPENSAELQETMFQDKAIGAGDEFVESAEAGENSAPQNGKNGKKAGFRGIVEDLSRSERSGDESSLLGLHRSLSGDQSAGRGVSGKDPLNESRSREKRRDKVTIEVHDLRTGAGEGVRPSPVHSGVEEVRPLAGRGETEIIVELRNAGQGSESPAQAETGWEAKSGQAFENILARELHQNLNGDIVRQASMVLKDGGEGTI
ncbi:MAG: hypothetical protein LBN21_10720, partial [Treponema sp.]|nr:hypothetical protein [Treponema sp.]